MSLTRVRATKLGYSDNRTRRPGDVFDIDSTQVALSWMELAPSADLVSTDATDQRLAAVGSQVKDITNTLGIGGEGASFKAQTRY